MSNQQPRPPLWRELEAAFVRGRAKREDDCWGYAAEIRAVADELDARFRLATPETFVNLDSALSWLREQAQRAEAGE